MNESSLLLANLYDRYTRLRVHEHVSSVYVYVYMYETHCMCETRLFICMYMSAQDARNRILAVHELVDFRILVLAGIKLFFGLL